MFKTWQGHILGWIAYIITFLGSLAVVVVRHDMLNLEEKVDLPIGATIFMLAVGIVAIKVFAHKVALITNLYIKNSILYGASLFALWYVFKMFRAIEESTASLSFTTIHVMGVVFVGYLVSQFAYWIDKKKSKK